MPSDADVISAKVLLKSSFFSLVMIFFFSSADLRFLRHVASVFQLVHSRLRRRVSAIATAQRSFQKGLETGQGAVQGMVSFIASIMADCSRFAKSSMTCGVRGHSVTTGRRRIFARFSSSAHFHALLRRLIEFINIKLIMISNDFTFELIFARISF